MSPQRLSRVIGADGLTGLGLIAGAGLLLFKALDLSAMAGLLPVAMLGTMIVLGAVLAVNDVRKTLGGATPNRLTDTPGRTAGAFGLIVLYALAVWGIGFYPATLISVPAVAWLFGYRSLPRLALGTAIFVGGLYVIFGLLMSQRFPAGVLFSS